MWAVLALAARNGQVLTYSMMSQLTGRATAGVGAMLEPIQSYCVLNQLPPLTALVVHESDGMPGSGSLQRRTYRRQWLRSLLTIGLNIAPRPRKTSLLH